MSETKTTDKPAAKKAPEVKEDDIPEGFAACYVAIPGRVSRGSDEDGNPLGKAEAGERLIGPEASVKELKRRGLAAPKKELAHALFEQFKEQELARIAEEADVEAKRRAYREKQKADQLKAANLEWNG